MMLKQLINLTLLFFQLGLCGFVMAGTGFAIPRSEVIEIKDPVSERIYPLFIKTPRSYDSKPNKKYPVIFLMDASYSFQIVSGATRFPMNSRKMQEAIIVGVSYAKGSKGSSSRIRDFTPSKAKSWKQETGHAQAHIKFINEAVFSYVDKNYRTNAQRTFVGNSLGGLLGAYIILNEPNMFDSYVIGSPSIWFKNSYILSLPIKKPRSTIKVYVSVGALETPKSGNTINMVAGAKAFVNKLKQNNADSFNLKLSVVEDASHEIAFPTTAIQGLDWLYGIK